MARVFVSSAWRDREVAREVVGALRERGHTVPEDGGPVDGTEWWRRRLAEVQRCDVLVALVSTAYDASEACRLEARYAERQGVEVVEVDVDDEPVETAVWLLDDEPDEEPELEPVMLPVRPPPLPDAEPPPPAGPGARGELLAAVAMALVLAGLVIVLARTGGTPPEPVAGDTGRSAAMRELVAAVATTVDTADTDALPAARCTGAGGEQLVCRNPAPDVHVATIRPYADRELRDEAYYRAVQRLSGQTYRANEGACDGLHARGEVAWHDGAGEGRVFCVVDHQVMQLVWTQGDGYLGSVTGQPAQVVAAWWQDARDALVSAS
jgi:hypothetical protein